MRVCIYRLLIVYRTVEEFLLLMEYHFERVKNQFLKFWYYFFFPKFRIIIIFYNINFARWRCKSIVNTIKIIMILEFENLSRRLYIFNVILNVISQILMLYIIYPVIKNLIIKLYKTNFFPCIQIIIYQIFQKNRRISL